MERVERPNKKQDGLFLNAVKEQTDLDILVSRDSRIWKIVRKTNQRIDMIKLYESQFKKVKNSPPFILYLFNHNGQVTEWFLRF